jgi:hypothetical protein
MVNKSEITKAIQGDKIGDLNAASLKKFLLDLLTNYTFDSGKPIGEDVDAMMFVARWSDSVRHPFQLLHCSEMELALRWAGQGHFGEVEWPSIQAFNKYIRIYMELSERKAALGEVVQKLLPPKPVMTEEELRERMVWAWKGVEKAEREGKLYADTGNVLFDYMSERGKITLEDCDIEESVEYHTHFSIHPDPQ